jgi:hypothetical protein
MVPGCSWLGIALSTGQSNAGMLRILEQSGSVRVVELLQTQRQPVHKCLDRDDADLKLIGYLFVRRYHLDAAESQKGFNTWRVADFL